MTSKESKRVKLTNNNNETPVGISTQSLNVNKSNKLFKEKRVYNLRNKKKEKLNNKEYESQDKYLELLNKLRIFETCNSMCCVYVVEVFLYNNRNGTLNLNLIKTKLNDELLTNYNPPSSSNNGLLINGFNDSYLKQNVISIVISIGSSKQVVASESRLRCFLNSFYKPKKNWKFYFLPVCDLRCMPFEIKLSDNASNLIVGKCWILPNMEFHGLWESLEFDSNIKEELLDFCCTTIMFSNLNVNQKIINCNHLILFHGVPGCGKSTLAKALAQKLSIRWIGSYKCYKLIEINSQFLLSEYFSESSKLITKVFKKLIETARLNECVLYVVLIDEIETLLSSRDMSLRVSDPQDAVRAVNAILTHLDQTKQHKNILIITTTNLICVLDNAFLDRVDMKYAIEEPSIKCIHQIYVDCMIELVRKGLLVDNEKLFDINLKQINNENIINKNMSLSVKLITKACAESVGLSGRMLRKLPFLAYTLLNNDIRIECYLKCLIYEIRKYKEDTSMIIINDKQ